VRRWILALAVGVAVMVGVGGWGHPRSVHGTEDPVAGAAVRALTSHRNVQLSNGFAESSGYRPTLVRLPSGDLEAVAPDGGCSTPVGAHVYRFSDPCRQHDLGYDLLRYAADRGAPLGPWARRALDDEFARQVRAGCSDPGDPGCRITAAIFVAAVRFNSWRQGYGVPGPESVPDLVAPVLAGAGATLGCWILLRRRDRLTAAAVGLPGAVGAPTLDRFALICRSWGMRGRRS